MMLFSLTPRKLVAIVSVFAILLSTPGYAEFVWAPAQSVGSVFPDFTLSDESGEPRQLSDLGGENGSLIIFYRSADW